MEHTGNVQPQLDLEEHQHLARAKRVVVTGSDGSNYNELKVDANGAISTTGGAAGVQYTEGDVDASITGTAAMWEDVGNTIRSVSAATPLPVNIVAGSSAGTTFDDGDAIDTDSQGTLILGATAVPGTARVIRTAADGTVRVDPTGTTAQPVSGTVAISNPNTQYTEADVDASITGTAAMGETSGNVLFPLQLDANGNLKIVSGVGSTVNTNDAGNILDNSAFTDGVSTVSPAGFILDETPGTALTENDAAAARIDSKRAQICTIEDETTRGRRATVTAGNALKIDGSAVTQPSQDSSSLVDNAGFTDGTSRVIPAGYVFDDVAGTALTENDIAAPRIDSKRATISVIEDATTRGQKAAVSAGGALSVDTELPAAAALADNTANPTVPLVGACMLQFDGTNWDRFYSSYSQTRNTVGTGGGAGTAVNMTAQPMGTFAFFVIKDGGTVTAWTMALEGSLDNANWTSLVANTSVSGNPQMVWVTGKPVYYMRSNVTSITGAAGTCKLVILAKQP